MTSPPLSGPRLSPAPLLSWVTALIPCLPADPLLATLLPRVSTLGPLCSPPSPPPPPPRSFYFFVGIAIVCDDFYAEAIDEVVEVLKRCPRTSPAHPSWRSGRRRPSSSR